MVLRETSTSGPTCSTRFGIPATTTLTVLLLRNKKANATVLAERAREAGRGKDEINQFMPY